MREYSSPAKVEISPDQRLTDKVFERAAQDPDGIVFRRQEAEEWRDVTAKTFHDDVVAVAKGLIAAGIEHGDRVGLLARTRYEWSLIDYAIWTVGGVTVPIYDSSSEDQIEWVLGNSGAKAVFVEHADHERRVRAVESKLEDLRNVWQIEDGGITAVRESGVEMDVDDATVEERRTAVKADDLATIIYTSGTTGRPKGCKLTHRNILAVIRNVNLGQMRRVFSIPNRSILLFLPLAHSFARIIQVGCVESETVMGHFPSTGPELIDALASFRPTFLLGAPRVFEKVYNKAEQKATADGRGKIFHQAAETAIAYSQALDTPGGPSPWLRLKHAVFTRLVYRKILDRVGGRAEHAVSGSSALGTRLGHFFRGIGLTIMEGYGITETSAPSTANDPDENRIGTVGRPLPGVSIRIADDGEILIKGPHIMTGYWDNEAATKEAFDEDGWYRSGDIGELDSEGYLSITGRKKEIIVTSGGKNVAPAVLEDRVCGHPLVSQCMVVGDNRHFVAALITIDPEALEFWKSQHGKKGDPADLVDDPDLVAAVQEAVDNANKAVSTAESIRKFRILPREWSVEGGQVSDSLKIKRHVITQQFAAEIDAMYT